MKIGAGRSRNQSVNSGLAPGKITQVEAGDARGMSSRLGAGQHV